LKPNFSLAGRFFIIILHPQKHVSHATRQFLLPMSALQDIRSSLKSEISRLNNYIETSLNASNDLMNNVIAGYLTSKGKQIRPLLVLMSARFFSGNPECDERVIRSAAAVEMLHNATLIHDDVVDDADKRRGHKTINSVWDNHIAVLVGDFFLSTALREAVDTGDLRIVRSLACLGGELSVGEMDQICNARFHSLDEEAYMRTIGRKTASLFVSCVEMGAFSSGIDNDNPMLEAMRRFAGLLGLCFQIKDDIFDYFDADTVGKPTGNDLREGKITLPLLYALNRTDLPDQPAMLELSQHEQLDCNDIDRLISFAKRAGGIDYAYDTMKRLRDKGAEILAPYSGNIFAADFINLLDYIITRDY